MNNGQWLDEIINDPSDSFPEEIKRLFENQFENISHFSDNDILLTQNYLFDKEINKMSTGEFSNNMANNIIEINESDKAYEDDFPFSNNTIELEENEELNKNFIFKTKKLKKRGRRKINNTKRKMHSKIDYDNVLTKIQVHFLTFLINFSNDIIEPFLQEKKVDKKFKQINYADKKNVKIERMSKLKSGSIKDILQMKISPIYRNYGEDYNKEVYNYISKEAKTDKKFNWINNFFDMNYSEFFENYYYNFNKKINFSKETKPFYTLLEENENNPKMKKCLINVSKSFFNNPQQYSHKIFLIVKTKN